jgi:hypothetical protein
MVYISGDEVERAVREREALGRELTAIESRIALVLVGTSAIIYISLALLFELLFRFSSASLRVAMLFAPTANALAWTAWAAYAALTPRSYNRHDTELSARPGLETFDELEYIRYRSRRQARLSSLVILLSALAMVSLAYGLILAALYIRP